MLIGITLVSFAVMQLAPGDPTALQGALDPKMDANALAKLHAHYGLDQPLYVQYWEWLQRIMTLDFGTSFAPDGRPVLDKILERLPVTLAMNIIGLIVVLLITIPLGAAAARYQGSTFDRSTTVLVFLGFAAPSFWVGLLCMILFGVTLGWLPISGLSSFGAAGWPWHAQVWDWAQHLFLPIVIGVMGSLAGMSRFMRSSMLEVIRQDYITTARAKGQREDKVLIRHGLKNAMLPVITILGLSLPGLIGGSVIIESLFGIPGMGQLFYSSVLMRDYPLIMGILTLGAVLTLFGNLLADLAYAFADPRIRYKS